MRRRLAVFWGNLKGEGVTSVVPVPVTEIRKRSVVVETGDQLQRAAQNFTRSSPFLLQKFESVFPHLETSCTHF